MFLGIRAVIAPMSAGGGGSIVNVSSGAGLRATKYMIAYAASKYAVTGMTAAGALELARDEIRVNSIHPGVIDTPMLNEFGNTNSDAVVKGTPLRRMGTPEEIANVALFLASDESSYMTGSPRRRGRRRHGLAISPGAARVPSRECDAAGQAVHARSGTDASPGAAGVPSRGCDAAGQAVHARSGTDSLRHVPGAPRITATVRHLPAGTMAVNRGRRRTGR